MIVSEEDIIKYYESNKKKYEKTGKAHIASILLVQDAAGIEDSSVLQKKAQGILSRLKKGEAFDSKLLLHICQLFGSVDF